ncbi:LuxR C-terminal-related transcriptional regulator [Lelliottia sp. WAP21]|uniref:response regulator transcription factor n=1 Tax=Lelliottia sp. WAP21 TaxID=2877426 RepID=UPI001E4D6723|nr:response regulator transcription factor [Lelliottia sp. WAP21]
MKIKMAIADEQPVVLTGLRTILACVEHVEVIECCSSGEALLKMLSKNDESLDILLTDFTFSQGSNDDSFRLVRKIVDSGKVKSVFIFTDVRCAWTLQKLLQLGVACLLSKRDDITKQILSAITAVSRNKKWLSPYIESLLKQNGVDLTHSSEMANLTERELQVIRLYVNGLRLKEIADKLCRSVATVAVHKHNAMQKLNITNNIQLVTYVKSLDL